MNGEYAAVLNKALIFFQIEFVEIVMVTEWNERNINFHYYSIMWMELVLK